MSVVVIVLQPRDDGPLSPSPRVHRTNSRTAPGLYCPLPSPSACPGAHLALLLTACYFPKRLSIRLRASPFHPDPMPLRTTFPALLLLALTTLGSLGGSLVQTFCSDTGERGLALSAELGCFETDCHAIPQTEDDCTDEECCEFDPLPAQPFAPHSSDPLPRPTAVAAENLLDTGTNGSTRDERSLRLAPPGDSPGSSSDVFCGFLLPLLI